jgi:putative nucleotidyltransferase with HDIG domain
LELARKTSKYNHALMVSTMMQAVAETLHENEKEWKLVGLLHDLDYDETAGDFKAHGSIAARKLEGKLPKQCLYAIMSHDHRSGLHPRSKLDKALIAIDSLAVLVDSVKAMKSELASSCFAKQMAHVSERTPWLKQNIKYCEVLGLSLDEFVAVCFDSLKRKGLL